MKFGALPLEEAEDAILAHSIRQPGFALKKGRRLRHSDIEALRARGIAAVIAGKLEAGDIAEDEAAARIAAVLAGAAIETGRAFTGRVNLFAGPSGLLRLDAPRLDRLNRIDEAITVATLPDFARVQPKQMVATVKIIPFAVRRDALEQALALAAEGGPPLAVAPFRPRAASLIQTRLPGTKETVLDKTLGVTAERLSALGGRLAGEARTVHETEALAARLRAAPGDLLLIAGASAITDRRDVLPAAIEAAGGEILHFGMPVDPGNLLLLARQGGRPVLGLPGCARSPRPNGFDWVLERLFADLEVGAADIMGMGVGGLLTEIPTRPQPREGKVPDSGEVAGIVLAAGQSQRMGRANKLLAPVFGKPMLLHAVDAMLASRADPVIVVTGHEAEAVRAALGDRPVRLVHNPDYAEGLSTSLRRALEALPESASGVLIGLGDMPRVRARDLDRLIAGFEPAEGRSICVPTVDGKRGNPVLFARRFVEEMQAIGGDVGARHLIGAHAEEVCEIGMDDDATLTDIDTPAALDALTARATEPAAEPTI
jgi:molybdenum cofactor cytidylyltransferase